MSNEAAERLRWEIGVPYRIALLDEALATERKATVERIQARYASYVDGFPTANRTVLYQRALAFAEVLAQMAEQDAEAAR